MATRAIALTHLAIGVLVSAIAIALVLLAEVSAIALARVGWMAGAIVLS